MFRRSIAREEPRFLKDLLQALHDSEEADGPLSDAPLELATEAAPIAEPVAATVTVDLTELETILAEIALLRELSAEWKEAVRLDREQSLGLSDLPLAA